MPNEMPQDNEKNIKSILDWLEAAHGESASKDATGLQRQLLTLRTTPLPLEQRLKLLDLLYGWAAKITTAQFPALHEATLPVTRKMRQMVRAIQDTLEILAQDYIETLAEGTESPAHPRSPLDTLRPAMRCLSWHLTISHFVAAPDTPGIWQQLHSAFRMSCRLGLEKSPGPKGEGSIERTYLSCLLRSVIQPASFTSRELEFIGQYIERCTGAVQLLTQAPVGHGGIFWIDPDRDTPPYALARRPPPPDTPALYFTCDVIAQEAADHLAALESGRPPADLDLPAFAETSAGRGVLKRLSNFWGQPAKRKFPRRRQSYRADLCAGLDQLWHLLQNPDLPPPAISEWMITNESPDGYAMMHVSGATEQLRVGDIVALRSRRVELPIDRPWQICIVRWALSENPEHIELGLQVLSGHGIPATLALPRNPDGTGGIPALLLPKAPPLRPATALVLPTGTVEDPAQKLIVVVEQGNVSVLELRATHLDERTSSIEAFTVEADETP